MEKPRNLPMDARHISHSQNFLKSPDFVGKMIDKVGITRDDFVVEIGPGKGIITAELSKRAGHVVAIELDSSLARQLQNSFSDVQNVEIIAGDFIKWNLPDHDYKVFANIPFNMTADIVNKLLSSIKSPLASYLIMQDQAAGRFMGPPIGPTSQISSLLQPFYDMGIVTKIDRREFEPTPNVNAVLASFEQKYNPLINPQQMSLYRDFVVYGYNQWKPTITEALKSVFSGKQLDILERNLDLRGLKPSEINVEQWVGMFEVFMNLVPSDKKREVIGAENKHKNKQSNMVKEHRTRNR